MTDNTFNLVTKMYSEMTNKFEMMDHLFKTMNQRFDGIDQRFDGIDQRLDGMDKRFNSLEKKLDSKADKLDIVRLENKMDTNFKTLDDGYIQNSEQISRVEMKVDSLAFKVGRNGMEIRVIKGGRDNKVK